MESARPSRVLQRVRWGLLCRDRVFFLSLNLNLNLSLRLRLLLLQTLTASHRGAHHIQHQQQRQHTIQQQGDDGTQYLALRMRGFGNGHHHRHI